MSYLSVMPQMVTASGRSGVGNVLGQVKTEGLASPSVSISSDGLISQSDLNSSHGPRIPDNSKSLEGESAQGATEGKQGEANSSKQAISAEYSQSELEVIQQLKSRDREVRAHEAAHAAVGGQYAGSPTYTYQRGPDGQRYAIGGEVSISISPVANDPEATVQKMEVVRRAALAPAQPSNQDRQVAQKAQSLKQQAQAEVIQAKAEAAKEANEETKAAEDAETEDSNANQDEGADEKQTFNQSDALQGRIDGLLTDSNKTTFSLTA